MALHRGGLQRMSPYIWASLDLRVLLLHETSTAAPNPDDIYVSDLVPASNELVNDDYDRVALTGKTSTYDTVANAWELSADSVEFGPLTGATITQGVKGWALYAHVTNDSDSILIRSYTGSAQTFSGDDVRVSWTDGVVLTVAEG